SISLCKRRCCC
ncbi:FHIPEP family protein, partial [Chlamydia psittaci 06-1683]